MGRQQLPRNLEQRILEILEMAPERHEEQLLSLCMERPEHAAEIRRRVGAMSSMRGRIDAELGAGYEDSGPPEPGAG